jgi:hypothetical protein
MSKARRGRYSSATEANRTRCSGGNRVSGNWRRSMRSAPVTLTGRTGSKSKAAFDDIVMGSGAGKRRKRKKRRGRFRQEREQTTRLMALA